MNRLFRSSYLVWSLLALPMSQAAFAQPAPSDGAIAEIAQLEGPSRQQRLVDGAKKEGELVVYESMTGEDIAPIVDAFSRKYGIKVKLWRSSSENVLRRVVSETRAGRFEADVVENNAPEMEALHREKLLQRVRSPQFADLMPQAVPAHGEWAGHTLDVFVQAYNTEKIRKEDLPKTFHDLLDPKWKGRLGIESDDQAWFAALAQELGEEATHKLFKELVATNGLSVRKGHTLLTNLVAAGEVPLGLTIYNNKPEQLKQKGAAIDWFVMQPIVAQLRSVGVLKTSPHPHAALLFYDYMLGEAQQISFSRNYVPTSRKIDAPLARQPLKFIDPALALDMNEKWLKTYEDVVTKRAAP
ncbi:extracellular solute-binding protein [Aromatoleum evansii]|uniref:Extracellular solute-binding protein n=1 Tax=Aromatoleum evansii TaxID=59406 RepID=A0ABZ1AU31_AROEV|nr:extracellular solute-binding protein [Aromatoleum toluclasticum]WRL48744.1 extracellular solute-binding protein [Aromatoleum evansii]